MVIVSETPKRCEDISVGWAIEEVDIGQLSVCVTIHVESHAIGICNEEPTSVDLESTRTVPPIDFHSCFPCNYESKRCPVLPLQVST
ncbi:hypothetical protein NPIL_195991 [Nephila pilipes]|uniref:Uncharacterized protein n=1 Tax=Nephila pilipes TaxID=299642 RepID=A0A8X6TIH7_NEPPI|nr:hypothetical protein NPIL_195991 [Nephila pilipes]